MYRFHYDYMQPKYGNKVQLDYMDTDNLAYEIETEDFNKDIAKDVVTRFDTKVWKKKYGRETKSMERGIRHGFKNHFEKCGMFKSCENSIVFKEQDLDSECLYKDGAPISLPLRLLIYNPRKNIWNKVDNSRKTGQEKKSLTSTFASIFTVIAKV